jgi:hypothetical protein
VARYTVLLFLLALLAYAEDWRTTDGTIYKNVKVLSHDAASVTILHEDGGGKILLKDLPPELQIRFGYNTKEAAAVLDAQAAEIREERQERQRGDEAAAKDAAEDDQKREQGQHVRAKVIQVLPGGLLCQVPSGDDYLSIYIKTDSSTAVDGDTVYFFLMPDGRFQYTSTDGAQRTVSQWIPSTPPPYLPPTEQAPPAESMGSINNDVLSGAFRH